MSGRGRGRGRGGGGGRGGGPGGQARDILQDTAEELGLTFAQLGPGENGPPPLFPPLRVDPPPSLTEKEIFMIQKSREMTYRLENSPFFVSEKKVEPDVERFFDRHKATERTTVEPLWTVLARLQPPEGGYLPPELMEQKARRLSRARASTVDGEGRSTFDTTFKKLEEKEKQTGEESSSKEQTQEQEEPLVESDVEEDDMDDYAIDYYASADELSDGDGEATF